MAGFNFKSLFKPSQTRRELAPGEKLQLDLAMPQAGRTAFFGFISLSCSTCIELLPSLIEQVKHREEEACVVGIGAAEPFKELERTFGYAFEAISSEQARAAHIYSTPFGCIVDSEGVVLRSGTIETLEDFVALLDGVHAR